MLCFFFLEILIYSTTCCNTQKYSSNYFFGLKFSNKILRLKDGLNCIVSLFIYNLFFYVNIKFWMFLYNIHWLFPTLDIDFSSKWIIYTKYVHHNVDCKPSWVHWCWFLQHRPSKATYSPPLFHLYNWMWCGCDSNHIKKCLHLEDCPIWFLWRNCHSWWWDKLEGIIGLFGRFWCPKVKNQRRSRRYKP